MTQVLADVDCPGSIYAIAGAGLTLPDTQFVVLARQKAHGVAHLTVAGNPYPAVDLYKLCAMH